MDEKKPIWKLLLEHIARAISRVVLFIVVAAILLWWFTIYDTARGRCERGDLGACIVWESQQSR